MATNQRDESSITRTITLKGGMYLETTHLVELGVLFTPSNGGDYHVSVPGLSEGH